LTGSEKSPEPRRPQRGGWLRGLLLAVGGIILVLTALVAVSPMALRSPRGLALVESIADGLPAGRLGHLEVKGLSGDPLGELSVRRLAIRDEKGVWLDASNLKVRWSPLALAGREVKIENASAERVRIFRRPVLGPPQPPKPLPVTVTLTRLSAVIEMEPEFSVRRGLFRVGGNLQARRGEGGGYTARLDADSLLRQGDHLDVDLDLGDDRPLKVRAEALEVGGGALAGALGLAAAQPFRRSL
jgi:translocation and assembly module TamB